MAKEMGIIAAMEMAVRVLESRNKHDWRRKLAAERLSREIASRRRANKNWRSSQKLKADIASTENTL